MNPEEIKQKTMTMRSGMVRMLRDREYWTAEDVETLKNEYYAGTSINEIAIMLDRSESAVYQKIEPVPVSTKSRSCWIGQKVRYTKRLSSWDCVSEVRFPPAGEMALPKKVCACVRAASVIQVPALAAVDRK